MNAQRPRTWPARVALGIMLGTLVAALAFVGYGPSGRPADASFQPQPTSVAFVPLYPEPSAPAQRLGGGEAFAANMAALYAEPIPEIVDTDPPPPPAPADEQQQAQNEVCAFPCVPEISSDSAPTPDAPKEPPSEDSEAEDAPVSEDAEVPDESISEDGEAPEVPSDVESSEDIPETD